MLPPPFFTLGMVCFCWCVSANKNVGIMELLYVAELISSDHSTFSCFGEVTPIKNLEILYNPLTDLYLSRYHTNTKQTNGFSWRWNIEKHKVGSWFVNERQINSSLFNINSYKKKSKQTKNTFIYKNNWLVIIFLNFKDLVLFAIKREDSIYTNDNRQD